MHRRTMICSTGLFAFTLMTEPALAYDRRALQRARISLVQAVEAAERSAGPAARAVEAEFDGHGEHRGKWEIRVVTPDRMLEVQVDAESGQVLRTENERLERFLRRLTHRDLEAAPISMAQAVSTAEQRVSGARAAEAEIKRRDDRAVWAIEMVSGERRYTVRISAADGTVLAVHED